MPALLDDESISCPQFTYDSAGRLSAENRSGTGAYSKNYTYDANDNRLSLSVAGRLEPTRLNFTTALNSTLIPVAGTWTVLAAGGSGSNDNLQAVCAGYEAAQATVSIPDGTAPYSVTLLPDVTPLLTGMSLSAGFTFSATTNDGNVNTFFASVKFEKSATELTRILQIENTTTPAVPVPIVAQSAAVIYTQDTDVLLSVAYISDTKMLSVAMGSEKTTLALPLENFSGNVGLEVSSSTVPTSAPAQPATCVFKEFVYQKIIPPVNLTYSYNSMNQLIAINGSESATFVYDDLGNMTSQNWTKEGITQTTTFAYDALNRQTQSGDQSSTYYGASGLRKTGLVNGIETTFIHDGNTCLSSISNAGGAGANVTTNYFVPGSAPLWESGGAGSNGGAGANGGGAITTYGMERGHVTSLIGSGGVATRFNYDAFGNMTAKTFGSTTVDKSSSGPRYNGYYLDGSQHHYATGYRPYRPDIGRFSSLDPAGSPNGPNRYNYCGSDPVNQSDPDGLSGKWVEKIPPGGVWEWVDDGGSPTPPTNEEGETDAPEGAIGVYNPNGTSLYVAYKTEAAYKAYAEIHNGDVKAQRKRLYDLHKEWAADDAKKEAAEIERKKHWSQLTSSEKIGGIGKATTSEFTKHKQFMTEGFELGMDIVTVGEATLALSALKKGVSVGSKVVRKLAQEGEEIVSKRGATVLEESVAGGGRASVLKGQAGEKAAGISESKLRIPSLTNTAKYRIPDELTNNILREIKNVNNLSNTAQLRDFLSYSQQTYRTFVLEVAQNTKISGPLQKLVDDGLIILKRLNP